MYRLAKKFTSIVVIKTSQNHENFSSNCNDHQGCFYLPAVLPKSTEYQAFMHWKL
jgi:hypothetical protein